MSDVAQAEGRPLEEVMLAMDVVDTLRHREHLVARELSEEERDRQLVERLREIYRGQGIEVSDEILNDGVKALKEQRFTYTPPAPSLQVTLASLYVRRKAWGRAALAIIVALGLVWGGWYLLVQRPAQQRAEAERIEITETLPDRIATVYATITSEAEVPEAREQADALVAGAERALNAGDLPRSRAVVSELESLRDRLLREYELRIVSRPGETTGVWRIPDINEDARNYYLVVQPVTPDGEVLTLPVVNEETGETVNVSQWGVRVSEQVFNQVRRDKEDDGIIQNDRLAEKRRGRLEPDYLMPVLGGAITSW